MRYLVLDSKPRWGLVQGRIPKNTKFGHPSRCFGVTNEGFEDPQRPGGSTLVFFEVGVVALPDLETGGHNPWSSFEAIAVFAHGGPEIQAKAELGRLDGDRLVGLN